MWIGPCCCEDDGEPLCVCMGPSDEISGHGNGGKEGCVTQTGDLYPLVQDHPDFADDGDSFWFYTPFG